MKKASSGSGKGLISSGGDKGSYLGHFRGTDVLKKGHNQGGPGGQQIDSLSHPALNPISNPEGFKAHAAGGGSPALTGRAKANYDPSLNPVRAQRQAEKAAGTFGTEAGKVGIQQAKKIASNIPLAQRQTSARAAVGAADKATTAGRNLAADNRIDAISGAKQGLQSAVSNVHSARQAVRSAIRGGDIAGAGTASAALKSAKASRKSARQGVRSAKKSTYTASAPGAGGGVLTPGKEMQ